MPARHFHLTRLLAMLSATNRLLIRARDRDGLFDGICRIAVEPGQFLFAWVGLLDDEGRVVPVARAGEDRGYIDQVIVTARSDDAHGRGPTGTALRDGRHIVLNDFHQAPGTEPWRAAAARAGVAASAAFPLRQDGRTIGALNLYSDEVDFFSPTALPTLDEMAADISFGLDTIVQREAREAADRELEIANARLNAFLEASPSVSYVLEDAGDGARPVWVSANIDRLLGYSEAEALTKGWWTAHVHPGDRAAAGARYAELQVVGWLRHEYRFLRKDGTEIWVLDELRAAGPGRFAGIWTDITDRRRAEQALRTHEEWLNIALDAGRQGLFEYDIATGQATVSPEYARMLGHDPATFTERLDSWRARLHPDDAPEAEARLDAYLHGRAPEYRVEVRMRHADGGWRWVLSSGRTIERDAAGRPLRMAGTHTDITALKEAALARREEAKLRQRLLDSLAEGVVACDAQGRLTMFNAVARQWHGVAPDATLDAGTWSSTYSLYEPDGRALLPADRIPLVRALRGETIHDAPFMIRVPDEPPRHIRSSGGPLRDEQGTLFGALVVMHDVTAAHAAEASLRLRSAALEAAANAIVITDRDGAIEWANPAFTALTQYTLAEAVGRTPGQLLKSDAQPPAFYAELWRTIAAGEVWDGELVNRRKDGTLYPERLTITPVRDASGEIAHYIAIKRDLTEDRELQSRLLQSQKLESIGRLAGGIAHDFNNLLTVINGTIDLATMGLRPDDPLAADLKEVRTAGARASALTRQLLAFSRQQVLRPRVLSLNAVVQDLNRMLGRLIGEDIVLTLELEPQIAPVLGDPGQLEQVLVNLAVNARDAMPKGGTLAIGTDEVVLDAQTPHLVAPVPAGRYVRLRVRDSGTGMDAATQSRIFEPFFTTKEAGKGTGLGLATVYGIVQQSGGTLAVTSAPGAGSTFDVFLPVTDRPLEVERPRTEQLVHASGAHTILVVDDELGLRNVAERILTRVGYQVITAASGENALDRVARLEQPVDLLLTDVVMPGMSGPELAARLDQRWPGLSVLFTSGYTDDTIIRHGLEGRTIDFLGKPYSVEALTRRVGEALARRASASSDQ